MSSFYLTTPIFYVNGSPHIGHAYTAIIADLFARHYRQRGREVFLLTGTDEHGLKIQRSAEAQGLAPKQLADQNAAMFQNLFTKLNITYDRFIRTTDADHRETAQEMVRRLTDAGAIYRGHYEGWYAASDEAYYDDSEVEEGRSTVTGATVEWIQEPSYFFRLSAYQDALLAWYDEDPSCIQPAGRRNEVRSFVEGGLNDISISRGSFDWGIPYPDDPEHVLYVWIDALTNYYTGVGGFQKAHPLGHHWPADVHLIGKDILRFHTVYWPAFLMAAGLPLPKQVFAHGWWLNEGEKMSKSLNNFIDAFDLVDRYPLDLVRYYLVREIPLGNDGNFAHDRLAQRNNSELADNLGNLVNRSFAMLSKFLEGRAPSVAAGGSVEEVDHALRLSAEQVRDEVCTCMDRRQPSEALERIMHLSSDLNQYCAVTQPWSLAKKGDVDRLKLVLGTLLHGLAWVATLAAPFLPDASKRILDALKLDRPLQLDDLTWDLLTPDSTLVAPDVLFHKYDLDTIHSETATNAASTNHTTIGSHVTETNVPEASQQTPTTTKPLATDLPTEGTIGFDTFEKVEIRCARIETAERVPKSSKLLRLTVDVGEDALRTVVAGIGKHFEPETIVGLHVAAVTNLKPTKIFGIESQAMLLAVDTNDNGLSLTVYSDNVDPGTRVG